MSPIEQYVNDRDEQVRKNLTDRDLTIDVHRLTESLVKTNFVKNFTYRGIPILQYPTDLMVMQELIWQIKPEYIIETGIAFGGMTTFYSDILQKYCGKVIAVDIDIREHALKIFGSIIGNTVIIQGSSISEETVDRVYEEANPIAPTLVSLDSNHTHDHVLQELKLYSPLVSVGSYIVVFDTAIEFYHHLDKSQNRAWSKGNNPWTATQEFLKSEMGKNFVIDKEIEKRALITSATDGWLRRIK